MTLCRLCHCTLSKTVRMTQGFFFVSLSQAIHAITSPLALFFHTKCIRKIWKEIHSKGFYHHMRLNLFMDKEHLAKSLEFYFERAPPADHVMQDHKNDCVLRHIFLVLHKWTAQSWNMKYENWQKPLLILWWPLTQYIFVQRKYAHFLLPLVIWCFCAKLHVPYAIVDDNIDVRILHLTWAILLNINKRRKNWFFHEKKKIINFSPNQTNETSLLV